jgi:hypothetical protein
MNQRRVAKTIIVLLLFCQFASTSYKSVQSWSNYSNFYKYSYYKESTIFDNDGNQIDSEIFDVDYYFYNLTVINDTLFFRSSENQKILAFLSCEDLICYNMCLYEKFDYDPITDTVAFGFEFDQSNRQIYIVNALSKEYANYFEYDMPFDIMQVFLTNYLWFGLFGVFLPVSHANFSLKTDYSVIEEGSYTSFNCEYSTEFRYRGTKYLGHHFKINFEGGVYFDYTVVFENHKIEYKYSDIGELLSFEDKGKVFSNYSGESKLIKKKDWNMYLEERGTEIFKANYTILPMITLLIFMVLIRIKKR